MADRVLVIQPGVRPVPLMWESRVQDIGPPKTSQLHEISNSRALRDMFISTLTPSSIQGPASYSAGHPIQTTCKRGIQPHPLAEKLPKIIISSQAPQNTPPGAVLPTRTTRSSLIHQNTGTSPHHQEAYTTHGTNLTHWGQTPKNTGTTDLQAAKRRPQTVS